MKSVWRKHLIVCFFLGLLAVPIYFLDHAFLVPQTGGGNWITLDFPDESHPTEIHVSVVVRQPGKFAGNVTGEQTDASGSSATVFVSTNGPESQRQVSGGDRFTYSFPLRFLNVGYADDVRITLYLF